MVVRGAKGVQPFLDDILVGGTTRKDHLQRLHDVVSKLAQLGLRLRREKCQFLQESIDFLGHFLDAQGLKPQENKINAIIDTRGFLGMTNFYAKFINNNAHKLAPLDDLLKTDTTWDWKKRYEDAFNATKIVLTSSEVIVHYDLEKPILLACDASPFGIGAVLSHMIGDGDEKPMAFASRTLATAEKN